MELAGQRAQPPGDRRGLAGPELGELLADAHLAQGLRGRPGRHRRAVGAEEARHHHRVAGVHQLLAERRDLGRDAGDLVDDDDPGTAAPPVRRVGDTVVRVGAGVHPVGESHVRSVAHVSRILRDTPPVGVYRIPDRTVRLLDTYPPQNRCSPDATLTFPAVSRGGRLDGARRHHAVRDRCCSRHRTGLVAPGGGLRGRPLRRRRQRPRAQGLQAARAQARSTGTGDQYANARQRRHPRRGLGRRSRPASTSSPRRRPPRRRPRPADPARRRPAGRAQRGVRRPAPADAGAPRRRPSDFTLAGFDLPRQRRLVRP